MLRLLHIRMSRADGGELSPGSRSATVIFAFSAPASLTNSSRSCQRVLRH
jgi:hypothetical protein